MFSKRIRNIWHKLAFRLTLWYAIIFIVSLFGALVVFFVTATDVVQKQIDRELLDDLHEVAASLPLVGANSPEKAIQIEAEDGKLFLRLLDPRGKVIVTSKMKQWNTLGIDTSALRRIKTGMPYVFVTQTIPGKTQKIRVLYGLVGPGKILQISISIGREMRFISALKTTIAPIMVIFVLFSAGIGWFMANRALSGVAEVTKAALDISKGAFGRKVHIKSKSDEIELLANTFNRMLDHINDLIKGLKEVTDNIAHDLKTPITRMRVAAEMELSKTKCGDEIQELAADIIEECDNLLQMINTMLMISKEESGISQVVKKSVDISKIIKEAFELFSPVAEEKGIHLLNQVPDNVVIMGDVHGIQRMIINLLENAIKYTPEGGTVTISSYLENDHIRITINDTGIGISAEDIPHIFKRLYRCDRSRSQHGYGLGLSLAMAVAHAHNGDITVASQLGKGSTFNVIFPRFSPS